LAPAEGRERIETSAHVQGFVILNEHGLRAAFGIGDLTGVEEAEERIVRLSPRSMLGCPVHDIELRPDACRSCRFLAGESRSDGQ
jgi:hypothetical protein